MNERWLPIKGFYGYYEVSSMGNIRSVRRTILCRDGYKEFDGKLLKQYDKFGYRVVFLSIVGKRKCRRVHQLVVDTFHGYDKTKMEIDHINGIKSDNRVENLDIVTKSENNKRAIHNGLRTTGIASGSKHFRSKLTEEDVAEIRKLLSEGQFMDWEIAEMYKVTPENISSIKLGKTWKKAEQVSSEKGEGK